MYISQKTSAHKYRHETQQDTRFRFLRLREKHVYTLSTSRCLGPNMNVKSMCTMQHAGRAFPHLCSLVSLWMFVTTIIAVCHRCEPTFKAGNQTCLVDTNATVEIAVETCAKPWPSMEHMATTLMLLAMTTVSWVGAVLARKTVKSKTTHIITVGTVQVPDAPVVHDAT